MYQYLIWINLSVSYNIALPAFIKQEPQATAEEVTASVLQVQLSLTSADLSDDLSASDASHDRELQNNIDAVIQAKVEVTRMYNIGIPLCCGIG